MPNVPRGRQKNVTGQGKSVYKRGSGLGTGPVGKTGGYSGRPGTTGSSAPNSGASNRPAASGNRPAVPIRPNAAVSGDSAQSAGTRGTRRSPLLIVIILAVLLLGGGGAGLGGLLGGGSTTDTQTVSQQTYTSQQQSVSQSAGSSSLASALTSNLDLSSLMGGLSTSTTSTGWTQKSNSGVLNTSVDSSARAKYTKLVGGGKDTMTIMVYMCGTDLESRSGMGTADLQEMAAATLSDKVNLIVMTGGCKQWQNSVVSASVNQIYKVESGGLRCLEKNAGNSSMVKPANLTDYIKWCNKNYPADRNMLILWDHGGGSISGYGYDEKNASAGSMTLKGINQALKDAGTKFDIIGFDACLMATTENALMLSQYADYMIASEETEPGVGWYYTNWLTKLSQNTSMSSVEIGKNIVDDFVDVCGQKCRGQKTTLSVVDLAELSATAPAELSEFASSTSEMISGSEYQTVATARSGAREFSASSRLDQVDLVSFASKLGTAESKQLADALLGAIKYNRTSSDMTDAYGLSIYFPYQKVSAVDGAVATFDAIGMDDDYLRCIQQFASMETAGQAVAGGSDMANPLLSLLGSGSGSASSAVSSDMIGSLLNSLMGGNLGSVANLTGGNTAFFGKSLDLAQTAQYLTDYRFDPEALVWQEDSAGNSVMVLPQKQWELVHRLELNVFVDDGEGFIDLGLDNVYDFTDEGGLLGEYDGSWIAIDGQPVAFYYIDTVDDGTDYTITGRVPVMLNGQRADLMLVFDNDHPDGYVAGARYDYRDGETDTVAKLTQLADGDTLDFLCDYYGYDGSYQDSYYLGDPMTVSGELQVSNVYVGEETCATYLFTDLYQQEYWTPVMN